MIHRFALLLVFAGSATGCVYLADRGLDLAQTVDLAVGVSEGVEANARATKVVQVGIGSYRGLYWVGLQDGLIDVWQEERSELGIGPLYTHEVFRSRGFRLLDIRYPLFADPGFREYPLDLTHLSDRGFFDIGATVNLVFLGANVAVKPAEILDFLTGLFTVDLLRDDVFGPDDFELTARLCGADARVRAAAARALRFRTGENHGYALYSAPEQMPAWQIKAVNRWRESLGTLRPGAAGSAAPDVTPAPAEEPPPASPEDR